MPNSASNDQGYRKGRGAQSNVRNGFLKHAYTPLEDAVMPWDEQHLDVDGKTQYIDVFPKSILSKNDSPDLGFNYSLNPYNGCEHGCTYCYARNSHEYWGYSAGVDFEKKILVKRNASKLLEDVFRSGSWIPQPIALSGNTDCYQPAERTFGITRKILEVFLKYKHPVGIITKNALIMRDLDLLKELNQESLVRVTMSITTLREEVRRAMEPRTSSAQMRLKALEELVRAGIPVNVNLAPIVPGINSDEVFDIIKTVGQLGAEDAAYILVRLNGRVASVFEEWLYLTFPERAQKVMNAIKEMHGGTVNESRWGIRMKGEGHYAVQVADMFRIATAKFLPASEKRALDYSKFINTKKGQLSFF